MGPLLIPQNFPKKCRNCLSPFIESERSLATSRPSKTIAEYRVSIDGYEIEIDRLYRW